MHLAYSVLILFCASFAFGQTKEIVKIEGFAPTYVGKQVEVYEVEDYFSLKESRIASAEVQADSSFILTFFMDATKRVIIRGGNNRAYMYVQPKGHYYVYLPEKDKYEPYRPAGNLVELTFYDLDSNDINYKILGFNRWTDNYLADKLPTIRSNPAEYERLIDTFKTTVNNYYIADTNTFFYDYIYYSMATLDNIQKTNERNKYQKYFYYLQGFPVLYENDAYMDYFTNFYRGFMPSLPMEVNNRVYLGILKSSPTVVMKALGKEYTVDNLRIRELVMIQMLSEAYFTPDYPQTNILTILDSVSNHAMFREHKVIARNMYERLTEVANGGKAPEFTMRSETGELKMLSDFKGKHLYLHFFDPNSEKSKIEIPLLLELYAKYLGEIQFVTICKEQEDMSTAVEVTSQIPWDVFFVPKDNDMWKRYKIQTFPNYVLIDGYGYVVAAPALGPQPNSSYETIERTFFNIQKTIQEMNER